MAIKIIINNYIRAIRKANSCQTLPGQSRQGLTILTKAEYPGRELNTLGSSLETGNLNYGSGTKT